MSARPPISDLITFLYTDDLAGSARFYEEILGLELVIDQGSCRIWRAAGSGYVGLCEREDAARPDGVILTLVTDEVDAWAEHLRQHGVALEEEPRFNPRYGIYHLFARDPSGYRIEIQRFERDTLR